MLRGVALGNGGTVGVKRNAKWRKWQQTADGGGNDKIPTRVPTGPVVGVCGVPTMRCIIS